MKKYIKTKSVTYLMIISVLCSSLVCTANHYVLDDESKFNRSVSEGLESCPPLDDFAYGIQPKCYEVLNGLFLSRQVWEETSFTYYLGNHIREEQYSLNDRWTKISVRRSDLTLDDRLLWSNVFDGHETSRENLVTQEFNDDTCRDLVYSQGIYPSLGWRCRARDLFLYSIYLDTCLTSFKRVRTLSIRTNEGQSWYQHGLEMIEEFHSDESIGRSAKLTRQYAHAAWVVKKCTPFNATPFLDNLTVGSVTPNNSYDLEDLSDLLRMGHDAALTISARAGNEWALRSKRPPFPSSTDPEYWDHLYKVNRILVHHWLSGGYDGNNITDRDKLLHALAAYRLERSIVPDISFQEAFFEVRLGVDRTRDLLSEFFIDGREDLSISIDSTLDTVIQSSRLPDNLNIPWRASKYPNQSQ